MVDYDLYDELYEDTPRLERIRKNHATPVNEHHDLLRRTENAMNRHRRRRIARQLKEQPPE